MRKHACCCVCNIMAKEYKNLMVNEPNVFHKMNKFQS